MIMIPSLFFKNTPKSEATILAVVAFKSTVTSTNPKTRGVMYCAPGTPSSTSFVPKREAIPAATIPRGPTQEINSFSLTLRPEFVVLKKTPKGLTTKITTANNTAVSQLYIRSKSSMLMFAESKINKMDISSTLKDSLKYNSSFKLGKSLFPRYIPITTTANRPDS